MEQQELVKLIHKYCRPYYKKSPYSSYGIKSLFERLTGCYITQEAMREAMRAAGYEADTSNHYKIKIIDLPEVPTEYLNTIDRYRRTKNGRV